MAKRRIIISTCLVALLLMSFSVFSKSEQKITITFWNGFTASDGEILREIVDRFNKEYAGKIEIKMDIMPWDVFFQKLPPAIATKTAPSFVLMGDNVIPQYVAKKAIQPLDDIWRVTSLKESAFAPTVLEMFKYNGKYYEIPMQYNLIYLYWNKDLFKAAGLDPERPPQTWEELKDYAIKLTDPSKNQYGFGMPVKIAPPWYAPLIWGNGGEFFDLKTKRSLLNSPQNIKSLEFLQDLALNKKVTPRSATGPDLDNLLISSGNSLCTSMVPG